MKKTFVAGLLVVLAAAGAALAQEAPPRPLASVSSTWRGSRPRACSARRYAVPAGEAPERDQRRGHQEADRARQARHRDQDPAGRAREAGRGPEPGGAGQEAAGDRAPGPRSARASSRTARPRSTACASARSSRPSRSTTSSSSRSARSSSRWRRRRAYDLVLDAQVAYTINKDFDITRDVIVKADEAEKAKPAAAAAAGAGAGDPQAVGPRRRARGGGGEGALSLLRARTRRGPLPHELRRDRTARPPDSHPVPVRARGPDPRARPRGAAGGVEERDRGRGLLRRPLPGAAGDAGRPDPGVARPGRRHLAAQDGSRPAAASRSGWSASTRRSSAGPWCPATSCASRCGSSTGGATSSASTARCGWARPARPRPACCSRWRPCPPAEVDPLARVAPGAVLEPGVRVGPFCVVGAGGAPGPGDGARLARGDRRRHPRGRAQPLLPLQLDRPRAPGPQVPRRAEPRRDRRPQRVPRGDDRPPGHGRGRGAHPHRLGQPVHGPGARRPRLPRREPHDLRQRRHPGRPRRGAGLRDPRRLLGRPPVLPGRGPRVHGRRHRRHPGRRALLADRGQPGRTSTGSTWSGCAAAASPPRRSPRCDRPTGS